MREAFFEGKAIKEMVKPNWPIYKFNDYPTLASGPEPWRTLSPWWSPYEEHHHDGGWEARARFAEHLGVSIREMGRLTSVIREGWNSLGYLLIIRLKQPVWGFWGTFKGMDREAGGRGSKIATAEEASAERAGRITVPNSRDSPAASPARVAHRSSTFQAFASCMWRAGASPRCSTSTAPRRSLLMIGRSMDRNRGHCLSALDTINC